MTRIDAKDAAALLSQGGYDLVDVREPEEWAGGHLPGARHVPLGELHREAKRHLPRDKVIFVCGHGIRSITACAIAEQLAGLEETFSLDGGTAGWAEEGRPLAFD